VSLPPIKVTQSYINWTLASNRGIMAHLYQFQSLAGVNDYFTDFDIDISYGGNTYKSSSLRFETLRRKLDIGMAVDEQQLRIWASPTDTLFGGAFLTGVESGVLDGATIVRSRIVWQYNTGNIASDILQVPIGVFVLFTGYMSSVQTAGASHVDFKVKSPLQKLQTNMPRNYYQAPCLWQLFSTGCTLNKISYAIGGTVGAGPTLTSIPVNGGISPWQGADGLPYYSYGRLFFNTGVNAGLQVFVDSNDAGRLYLAYPLNALPSAGDSITYYPGCSKSYNTCATKYANQAHFRGFDKVPPISVSV
jgi:uncharacterized phage protein (TIGR02218 family)